MGNIYISLGWVEAPVCAPFVHYPISQCMSARGEVGSVTVVVVVRAYFLHQFVVGAVEGNEDADDFKRFGAKPGDMALGLLLVAGLGWVIVAEGVLGTFLYLLILYTAIEGFRVLGIYDGLLRCYIKLYYLSGRDQADRHIALACGVVAEVDTEGAIAVVHNLTSDKQVEFDRLDIRVKVPPAEHFLKFPCLDHRPPFSPWPRVLQVCRVPQPVPEVLL